MNKIKQRYKKPLPPFSEMDPLSYCYCTFEDGALIRSSDGKHWDIWISYPLRKDCGYWYNSIEGNFWMSYIFNEEFKKWKDYIDWRKKKQRSFRTGELDYA